MCAVFIFCDRFGWEFADKKSPSSVVFGWERARERCSSRRTAGISVWIVFPFTLLVLTDSKNGWTLALSISLFLLPCPQTLILISFLSLVICVYLCLQRSPQRWLVSHECLFMHWRHGLDFESSHLFTDSFGGHFCRWHCYSSWSDKCALLFTIK